MKLLMKSLVLLVALVVVAAIALVLLVDVNRFKPMIQTAASKQGVALQIGDLGWTLWPVLGVSLTDVKVAAQTAPDNVIAELRQASLATALMPLLKGELKVDSLLVDGAVIHLAVDAQGKGNWEALTTKEVSSTPAVPVNTEKSEPNLAISRIYIRDSSLNYVDAKTGQSLRISQLNLDMDDVNTGGNPFGLALSWVLEITQSASANKLQIAGKLTHQMTLDKDFNNLQLDKGNLQLTLIGKSSADMALDYSLTVNDLQNNPVYQGQLKLSPFNLRQLLAALGTDMETANSDALKQFAANATLKGDAKQVSLQTLTLTLDNTHITGSAAVTDFATSAMKLTLQGDNINADDYLPPVSEAPANNTTASATADDTPLPLAALRELDLDASITMNRMTIKKMALENIDLQVKAGKGLVKQKLTARGYQGDITFNSQLDARTEKAKLDFDGGVQGLELAPLLKAMAMDEKLGLSGAIQAKTQGATQGASVNQLMAAMNSTANFSGVQVRMSPLNIEEKFCTMVNLLTQHKTEEVVWDAFTEMRQLDGNIVWRDQVINLESFNAGVSQLLLTSTGKINLAKDQYEFKLPIKLAKASQMASLKGCSLGESNYWMDRGLSLLRCKGSFGAIDPLKDCGFDKSALKDLTKDFAEYKLREKHGAKIDAAEQKVKDKKQDLLNKANEKLGGEGAVTNPRDIFTNLLKKKLGAEQVSSLSSSSAASQE